MKMKETRSEKILLFVVHLSPKVGKSCKEEVIILFFMQKNHVTFAKNIRKTEHYEVRHYQCNG
jgi:hypothetical protein